MKYRLKRNKRSKKRRDRKILIPNLTLKRIFEIIKLYYHATNTNN